MDWSLFAIFLVACGAAASTGAMFTPDEWYRQLDKPSWTPPDWVFPVTWATLYLLMALAAARATLFGAEAFHALALWTVQIVLNAIWSPIFFGAKRIRSGLIGVGALWLAVFATMVALWRVDWLSGALFVPYIVWVSIAFALNLAVLRRNEDVHARHA
ncbi:MAG: TspO/MBR family protein [Pseudomonadota bacterium]